MAQENRLIARNSRDVAEVLKETPASETQSRAEAQPLQNQRKAGAISRREFARRAALASAATALPPSMFVPASAATAFGEEPRALLQEAAEKPKLSPEGQIEMQARAETIFARYGKRLSEEQKKDILRLQTALQPQLESLRAYRLANSDAPALYLKPLVEREKPPSGAKPAAPAKR